MELLLQYTTYTLVQSTLCCGQDKAKQSGSSAGLGPCSRARLCSRMHWPVSLRQSLTAPRSPPVAKTTAALLPATALNAALSRALKVSWGRMAAPAGLTCSTIATCTGGERQKLACTPCPCSQSLSRDSPCRLQRRQKGVASAQELLCDCCIKTWAGAGMYTACLAHLRLPQRRELWPASCGC